MKNLIVLVLTLTSLNAFAARSSVKVKVTCETLQEKADDICDQAMCEEAEKDGYECIRDGDFYEGHQICAYEEFQDLLKNYNDKNPSAPLSCEEE